MSGLLITGAIALLLVFWFVRRRSERVPCEIDLERTHEQMHAHVELLGALVEPGDSVLLDDAPDTIEFGEVRRVRSQATVRHASWLRRKWTRIFGRLNIRELYDVGFE